MSTQEMRSPTGPGTIVEFPPSFVTRLTAAGYNLPNQNRMRQMMRATAVGLPWSTDDHTVDAAEKRATVIEAFSIYDLGEYEKIPDNQMGAPMPESVREHIRGVQQHFPGAHARVHAHPNDDPFVSFTLDGEMVFTKAWR